MALKDRECNCLQKRLVWGRDWAPAGAMQQFRFAPRLCIFRNDFYRVSLTITAQLTKTEKIVLKGQNLKSLINRLVDFGQHKNCKRQLEGSKIIDNFSIIY